MSKEEYSIEPTVLGAEWDAYIEASENGTIFLMSHYLKSLNAFITPCYVYNRKELRAAFLLIENENKESLLMHDFVIYSGIVFGQPAYKQNYSQINSDRFRLSTFVAKYLMDKYEKIDVALHPTCIDIRPFLWVNYGTELPQYNVDVRYTSYVQIEDFAKADKLEDISIYKKASNSRRQEIRYAIKEGVETKKDFDADQFVQFYEQTMERQQIKVLESTLEEMKILIKNLFEAGLGKMFVSCTKNGEPGSMAFFGTDNKRAYYLFGANDPDLRDKHTGTAVIWDAFKFLSEGGCSEVDLEGVNSPQRGWFKLSFGGDLRPYYQIYKK